jgi:hypothetical protein
MTIIGFTVFSQKKNREDGNGQNSVSPSPINPAIKVVILNGVKDLVTA